MRVVSATVEIIVGDSITRTVKKCIGLAAYLDVPITLLVDTKSITIYPKSSVKSTVSKVMHLISGGKVQLNTAYHSKAAEDAANTVALEHGFKLK